MAADVPCESRPRRDPVDSIAYALCANDESGDPDYGNDAVAQMVHDQLVSDGHLRTPTDGRCPNCDHDDHHGERCDGMADGDWCACSWPDPGNYVERVSA